MSGPTEGKVSINSEGDIVTARKTAREVATRLDFGITDVTRIVTAASELARNIYQYTGSGTMCWRTIDASNRTGLELTFEDHGPGIENVERAMQEGYSSGSGLGMGLPGARRLMDEMEIRSEVGQGTTVMVTKWKRS